MRQINWYQVSRFTTGNKWFWFLIASIYLATWFWNADLMSKINLTFLVVAFAIMLITGIWHINWGLL